MQLSAGIISAFVQKKGADFRIKATETECVNYLFKLIVIDANYVFLYSRIRKQTYNNVPRENEFFFKIWQ